MTLGLRERHEKAHQACLDSLLAGTAPAVAFSLDRLGQPKHIVSPAKQQHTASPRQRLLPKSPLHSVPLAFTPGQPVKRQLTVSFSPEQLLRAARCQSPVAVQESPTASAEAAAAPRPQNYPGVVPQQQQQQAAATKQQQQELRQEQLPAVQKQEMQQQQQMQHQQHAQQQQQQPVGLLQCDQEQKRQLQLQQQRDQRRQHEHQQQQQVQQMQGRQMQQHTQQHRSVYEPQELNNKLFSRPPITQRRLQYSQRQSAIVHLQQQPELLAHAKEAAQHRTVQQQQRQLTPSSAHGSNTNPTQFQPQRAGGLPQQLNNQYSTQLGSQQCTWQGVHAGECSGRLGAMQHVQQQAAQTGQQQQSQQHHLQHDQGHPQRQLQTNSQQRQLHQNQKLLQQRQLCHPTHQLLAQLPPQQQCVVNQNWQQAGVSRQHQLWRQQQQQHPCPKQQRRATQAPVQVAQLQRHRQQQQPCPAPQQRDYTRQAMLVNLRPGTQQQHQQHAVRAGLQTGNAPAPQQQQQPVAEARTTAVPAGSGMADTGVTSTAPTAQQCQLNGRAPAAVSQQPLQQQQQQPPSQGQPDQVQLCVQQHSKQQPKPQHRHPRQQRFERPHAADSSLKNATPHNAPSAEDRHQAAMARMCARHGLLLPHPQRLQACQQRQQASSTAATKQQKWSPRKQQSSPNRHLISLRHAGSPSEVGKSAWHERVAHSPSRCRKPSNQHTGARKSSNNSSQDGLVSYQQAGQPAVAPVLANVPASELHAVNGIQYVHALLASIKLPSGHASASKLCCPATASRDSMNTGNTCSRSSAVQGADPMWQTSAGSYALDLSVQAADGGSALDNKCIAVAGRQRQCTEAGAVQACSASLDALPTRHSQALGSAPVQQQQPEPHQQINLELRDALAVLCVHNGSSHDSGAANCSKTKAPLAAVGASAGNTCSSADLHTLVKQLLRLSNQFTTHSSQQQQQQPGHPQQLQVWHPHGSLHHQQQHLHQRHHMAMTPRLLCLYSLRVVQHTRVSWLQQRQQQLWQLVKQVQKELRQQQALLQASSSRSSSSKASNTGKTPVSPYSMQRRGSPAPTAAAAGAPVQHRSSSVSPAKPQQKGSSCSPQSPHDAAAAAASKCTVTHKLSLPAVLKGTPVQFRTVYASWEGTGLVVELLTDLLNKLRCKLALQVLRDAIVLSSDLDVLLQQQHTASLPLQYRSAAFLIWRHQAAAAVSVRAKYQQAKQVVRQLRLKQTVAAWCRAARVQASSRASYLVLSQHRQVLQLHRCFIHWRAVQPQQQLKAAQKAVAVLWHARVACARMLVAWVSAARRSGTIRAAAAADAGYRQKGGSSHTHSGSPSPSPDRYKACSRDLKAALQQQHKWRRTAKQSLAAAKQQVQQATAAAAGASSVASNRLPAVHVEVASLQQQWQQERIVRATEQVQRFAQQQQQEQERLQAHRVKHQQGAGLLDHAGALLDSDSSSSTAFDSVPPSPGPSAQQVAESSSGQSAAVESQNTTPKELGCAAMVALPALPGLQLHSMAVPETSSACGTLHGAGSATHGLASTVSRRGSASGSLTGAGMHDLASSVELPGNNTGGVAKPVKAGTTMNMVVSSGEPPSCTVSKGADVHRIDAGGQHQGDTHGAAAATVPVNAAGTSPSGSGSSGKGCDSSNCSPGSLSLASYANPHTAVVAASGIANVAEGTAEAEAAEAAVSAAPAAPAAWESLKGIDAGTGACLPLPAMQQHQQQRQEALEGDQQAWAAATQPPAPVGWLLQDNSSSCGTSSSDSFGLVSLPKLGLSTTGDGGAASGISKAGQASSCVTGTGTFGVSAADGADHSERSYDDGVGSGYQFAVSGASVDELAVFKEAAAVDGGAVAAGTCSSPATEMLHQMQGGQGTTLGTGQHAAACRQGCVHADRPSEQDWIVASPVRAASATTGTQLCLMVQSPEAPEKVMGNRHWQPLQQQCSHQDSRLQQQQSISNTEIRITQHGVQAAATLMKHNTGLLHRCLQQWQKALTQRALLVKVFTAAEHAWEQRVQHEQPGARYVVDYQLLQLAFTGWIQHTARKLQAAVARAAQQSAAALHRCRLLTAAWGQWKWHAQQAARVGCQHALLARSLKRWRQHAGAQLQQPNSLLRLRQACSTRTGCRTEQQWHQQCLMRRSLCAWVGRVHCLAAEHHGQQLQRKAMRSWQLSLDQTRQLLWPFMDKWQRERLLRKSLLLWRGLVVLLNMQQQAAAAAETWRNTRIASQVTVAWRQVAAVAVTKRHLLLTASGQYTRWLLQGCLVHWALATCASTAARAYYQRRLISRACRTWRLAVADVEGVVAAAEAGVAQQQLKRELGSDKQQLQQQQHQGQQQHTKECCLLPAWHAHQGAEQQRQQQSSQPCCRHSFGCHHHHAMIDCTNLPAAAPHVAANMLCAACAPAAPAAICQAYARATACRCCEQPGSLCAKCCQEKAICGCNNSQQQAQPLASNAAGAATCTSRLAAAQATAGLHGQHHWLGPCIRATKGHSNNAEGQNKRVSKTGISSPGQHSPSLKAGLVCFSTVVNTTNDCHKGIETP